jgi:hypothetical protein
MMNMSGTGGYILHAFKMCVFPMPLHFRLDVSSLRRFDDPDAQAILIHRQKKRKIGKPAEAQGTAESPGEDVMMSESLEDKQTTS